ncbi:MAG: hypothetical protein HY721_08400 [Planctomycetes bacterium]|nr:hypothetical protein [Planctomycetota bacterium]
MTQRAVLVIVSSVVLSPVLSTLAPPGQGALAADCIRDDFEDGDVLDGDPCWSVPTGPGLSRQRMEVQGGDLIIDCCETCALNESGVLVSCQALEGDIAVRTRVAWLGAGATGVCAFWGSGVTYCGWLDEMDTIRLWRFDGSQGVPLGSAALGPVQGDHVIELGTLGEDVEVRVWPAEEDRPEDPGIRVRDSRSRSGFVALFFQPRGQGARGIFRDFEACEAESPAPDRFVRGDADSTGQIDLSDGVRILLLLFSGGGALECEDAGDADDSGRLELTDAVRIFQWLFQGGAAPGDPAPSGTAYPAADCGEDLEDLTEDALGCAAPAAKCSG